MSTIPPSSVVAAGAAVSNASVKDRPVWKMYAFEVVRRQSRINVGAPIRPRRVRVRAPTAEAAVAGAGAAKDELSHAANVRPWDLLRPHTWPSREEIADFYDTVGNALATGGGMTLALNMAARNARSPEMRGVIGALHEMIIHGEDLHLAMRRFPRVFSPMQLAMVEAAAASGIDKAGALFVTLSKRLERDGKVWRKFTGALAYPLSLIALTIVGAIVLEIWALPPMVELFHTLGGRLPPLTQAFYAVAVFMHRYAAIVFPSLAALVIASGALVRWSLGTRAAQRMVALAWPFGPVIQWMALVRALGTFILLKQSGARVRDQFALAAAAAGNCVVGDFFEACYARIALGESVEEAFTAERHRLGDEGVRIAGKMEVGMAGADLSALINRIIDELNDRAESRLALLPNMVRWPLLIICCAIIGVVALAIVLPYPNLIADVAHQQSQATLSR